jgi:hypothetical protein
LYDNDNFHNTHFMGFMLEEEIVASLWNIFLKCAKWSSTKIDWKNEIVTGKCIGGKKKFNWLVVHLDKIIVNNTQSNKMSIEKSKKKNKFHCEICKIIRAELEMKETSLAWLIHEAINRIKKLFHRFVLHSNKDSHFTVTHDRSSYKL